MRLLCTLGPSSMDHQTIRKLTDLNPYLFRINLSHTKIEDLRRTIETIRSFTQVPICLDTEGAQIRTGEFEGTEFKVSAGDQIFISKRLVKGSSGCFNLTPIDVIDQLNVGTIMTIDFNSVKAFVSGKNKDGLMITILEGGTIGQNKAVTVDQEVLMSALTLKDEKALSIGREVGIKNVALSFAHRGSDVDEIRKHCLSGTSVISKVECVQGLQNLDAIIEKSDEILIDRGDLSREVFIEDVPLWQKTIIRKSNEAEKPVYVATNLLETMVSSKGATRAEINDIYNTIEDGVSGLVLAAETAIGKHPVECALMIRRVESAHNRARGQEGALRSPSQTNFLIPAHGGKLVTNTVAFNEQLGSLPTIDLNKENIADIEQIGFGTFSPLEGFMGRLEVESVLESRVLLSGVGWTLPIILQVDESTAKRLSGVDQVLVTHNNRPHSILKIQSVEQVDLADYYISWFGTEDLKHPGVKRVANAGDYLVDCKVFLIEGHQTPQSVPSFTPSQLRRLFTQLGWSKVVGFHTRNPAHRVHEFMQETASSNVLADGMLISPAIGSKKTGDFQSSIIYEAYKLIMAEKNAEGLKYLFSGFNTYSRYAGPREAVFTAICRQNMGCSHFIVGRDHTGVGDYYAPYASQDLLREMNDLVIDVIEFKDITYDARTAQYQESEAEKQSQIISGSEVRRVLLNDELLPTWFMRPEIQNLIKDRIRKKEKVFVE